jgi:hypothetical protein
MIVKHFYCNVWELGYNWENTDYVFSTPDSDLQVEQNEKSIAASLEISDNEQDMEEGGEEDKELFLPLHKNIHNAQASPQRGRRTGR